MCTWCIASLSNWSKSLVCTTLALCFYFLCNVIPTHIKIVFCPINLIKISLVLELLTLLAPVVSPIFCYEVQLCKKPKETEIKDPLPFIAHSPDVHVD